MKFSVFGTTLTS